MKKPKWDNVKEKIESADDGASLWVKLRDNGDKAVGVFLGDPYPREVVWTGERYVDAASPDAKPFLKEGKKPSLRIVINLAVRTEQGWTVKALEQTATFFKDVMKVDQKYGLDSWSFEIERHGAAGDPKTTYSILPEEKLSKEDVKALEQLELLDLEGLYNESLADAEKREKDGGFEEFDGEKVPDKVAEAMIVVLKELPREYTDRFLERFKIRRVRDLALKDKKAAIEFLDGLEAEAKKVAAPAPAAPAEVDPFA
jgi:hypothetical protein